VLLNKQIVVHLFATDVYLYAAASQVENELILASVLNAFHETLDTMLRGQIDRRSIMENLEIVMMTMDELVDDGIIMEIDSSGAGAVLCLRRAGSAALRRAAPCCRCQPVGALCSGCRRLTGQAGTLRCPASSQTSCAPLAAQ
jgi:hypothetical protein